jgi:spermidine synthase
VRARLARPSGLFVQWLPLWQLGARELTLIADTFASVFPGISLWIDDRDPERALLALVSEPAEPGVGPALAVRRLGAWTRDPARPLNSDERPVLEFSAPRTERSGELLTGARLQAFLAGHFRTPP